MAERTARGQPATANSTDLAHRATSPLNSDPMQVGFFHNPYPTVDNRQQKTNWQGRLIGRYVFKGDIGVRANLRVQSGFGYSRLIARRCQRRHAPLLLRDIENNRSDTVPILDLAPTRRSRRRVRSPGCSTLFNLANSNAVTNFTLINGARYNKIIGALDPRTLQFGLRSTSEVV